MVFIDNSSLQADSQPKSGGWSERRRPLGAVPQSSNEQSELSWWCHDDSTIGLNIVLVIIIISVEKRWWSARTQPMGCGCVADPIHTPLPTQVSMPHRTSSRHANARRRAKKMCGWTV